MEMNSISTMGITPLIEKVSPMSHLILYYFPECPYCQRVLGFMETNGIQGIDRRDTHANPAYRDELIQIGGKSQVPCLVNNGTPLYESLDIIEWLKQNRVA